MANEPAHVHLDRPLLAQVGGLGDAYDGWVHRSIKPKESLRIFGSAVLEHLSHIPWWLVPAIWVPIGAALWAGAVWGLGLPVATAAWLGIVGLFLWTLLEYVLHRFIFHLKPQTAFGRRLHFLAHGIHHLDPWDPTRLVFPPLPALGIAVPVFLAIRLAMFWSPAPLAAAMAAMAGIVAGYILYDMTHYYTHHARPRARWGKYLKRYHLAHHHKHPELLFGVSQPLWDIVFRTGFPRD